MSLHISIALDTRRAKLKTDTYPVVLLVRVNSNPYRYKTIFSLSQEEYSKLSASRTSGSLQNIREKVKQIQREADIYVEQNLPFNLLQFVNEFICGNPLFKPRKIKEDAFAEKDPYSFDFTPYEKKFSIFSENHSNAGCISYVYFEYIKKLIQEERIGSALNYQDSYNSIKRFRGNVCFADITVSFLVQYEQWMKNNNCSRSTIGIKLRPLRAVFNEAIERGLIRKDKCYPFGRRKYLIPTSRNIKKALSVEDVKAIYYFKTECPDEQKACDYWLFCYFANGMNPKDVALLKYKNIHGEYIVFTRSKTERTTRYDPKPITVYITEDMKIIIKRYANKMVNANTYLFPILEEGIDPLELHFKVRAFVKFINDRIKRIATELGIDKKVTTIVSRHSYSTHLKRAGASTEFIQEALGHTDKKTTENYLDSFENHIKKEFAEKLSLFKNDADACL